MTKLTKEEKVQIVLRYINGNESIEVIAKDVKITPVVVSGWIRLYEHHGVGAFLKSYTSYSPQFKMDVLNYMNETGVSSIEAASIFNISSHGMIRNWRKQWNQGGFDALQPKKRGRSVMKKETKKKDLKKPVPAEGTVEALQAKIDRLEMENAYLKKLNTLVQMQEKLQTKSKRK